MHNLITNFGVLSSTGDSLLVQSYTVLLVATVILWLLYAIPLYKIFTKAGVDGWKAFVLFYNYWTLCEITGKPGAWAFIPILMYIPIINFIAWVPVLILHIIIALELGRAFSKTTTWSIVWLLIFSYIGMVILGFGKGRYNRNLLATDVAKASHSPASKAS